MTPLIVSLGVALVVMAVVFVLQDLRRQLATEADLKRADSDLKQALEAAMKERERSMIQANDLQSLNKELLEMRTALINVLEDVEESNKEDRARLPSRHRHLLGSRGRHRGRRQ